MGEKLQPEILFPSETGQQFSIFSPRWPFTLIKTIVENFLGENVLTSLSFQSLRFSLYDVDSDSTDLGDHDNLGTAECILAQILATQENMVKYQSFDRKTQISSSNNAKRH